MESKEQQLLEEFLVLNMVYVDWGGSFLNAGRCDLPNLGDRHMVAPTSLNSATRGPEAEAAMWKAKNCHASGG